MTTEPFSIRNLGYGDLPQVIAIERRAFPTPWSLAMFVLELSKPSSICLAAVDEDGSRQGKLLGYTICSRYADVWHLMNIAVDPPWRRRGIGSSLLTALIERAGSGESYTLEVRPSNPGAIALYERFGFRTAGTRPRYYRDTGEDAVIMWRTADTTAETTVSPRPGSEGAP
ncbi:MAG TPA: ribosomal protein S18-alanine N-acetyltransferase [Solirubrobacteraceae bacterium]|nr:ribosomal protein S18-alanine N-acetyltransferase [Solirubrobacteraceae bacterium]